MKPPESRNSSSEKDPLTTKNTKLRPRTWGCYSGRKPKWCFFLSLVDNLPQAAEWVRTGPDTISEDSYFGGVSGLQQNYSAACITFPRNTLHTHFLPLGDDWRPYCCLGEDGGFSWSPPGFLILDLFFFSSQAMFTPSQNYTNKYC